MLYMSTPFPSITFNNQVKNIGTRVRKQAIGNTLGRSGHCSYTGFWEQKFLSGTFPFPAVFPRSVLGNKNVLWPIEGRALFLGQSLPAELHENGRQHTGIHPSKIGTVFLEALAPDLHIADLGAFNGACVLRGVIFTKDTADGDDVVFSTPDGAVVKRAQGNKLYSLNDQYPFGERHKDDHITILGKVIGIVNKEDLPATDDKNESSQEN